MIKRLLSFGSIVFMFTACDFSGEAVLGEKPLTDGYTETGEGVDSWDDDGYSTSSCDAGYDAGLIMLDDTFDTSSNSSKCSLPEDVLLNAKWVIQDEQEYLKITAIKSADSADEAKFPQITKLIYVAITEDSSGYDEYDETFDVYFDCKNGDQDEDKGTQEILCTPYYKGLTEKDWLDFSALSDAASSLSTPPAVTTKPIPTTIDEDTTVFRLKLLRILNPACGNEIQYTRYTEGEYFCLDGSEGAPEPLQVDVAKL